jgi:type II secretory pathway component PulK
MRLKTHGARAGFALIAVLWIIVGVSGLALIMNLAGRDALSSAQNRLNGARAQWRAEGCLERVRAAAAEALAGHAPWMQEPTSWETLDRAVLTSPYVVEAHCDVTVRSPGVALDVNAADVGAFNALFVAAGLPPTTADSLSRAIIEWRGDDTARIERTTARAWYEAAHRIAPRFGQFADVRELWRVRGFEEARGVVPSLDTILTTEPGRINLARAPATVLASLPGMTLPLIARIMALRSLGAPVTDLSTIAAGMPPDVQDSLTSHYLALRSMVTGQADAWIVAARATEGTAPAITATSEVRLVRAGTRAAIVRRRTWP